MATDSLARRLRFDPPSPTENDGISPQEDDLRQWSAIACHGPLPISYLAHYGDRRNYPNLQHRYTRFYHQGWVTRPPRQFASFHARYSPLIYDLTPKAKAALGNRACRISPSRSAPFVHQLMQACYTASLELYCVSAGLRFVARDALLPEGKGLTVKLAATKLTPDDVFAVERGDGRRRRYFLEVDRNTESIERHTGNYNTWAKKVQAYDELFARELHKAHYGFPKASILVLTTNPRHAENIKSYVSTQSRYADRYLFAVEETFGLNWRVPKQLLSVEGIL